MNKKLPAQLSDDEVASLQKELRALEGMLNELNIEKSELEKLLSNFQHQHFIELGDIILEILKLRQAKFKNDQQKYEEAAKDYENYNQQAAREKEKKQFEITDEKKQELKMKFRKASKLCHPDMVSDELKEEAAKVFIDLKNASEANDLQRVTDILDNLEKGNSFTAGSETISEKEKLLAQIEKLKMQVQALEREIEGIENSDTYKVIISIDDLNEYFSKLKVKLSKELESLREETI